MNAKRVALATLLVGSNLALGQDIVLKASYTVPEYPANIFPSRILQPVDVNQDGIDEVPARQNNDDGLMLFDVVTNHLYIPPCIISNGRSRACISVARGQGLAEWACLACSNNQDSFEVFDVETGQVLVSINTAGYGRLLVFDYDTDGLDDIILMRGTTAEVYGVATGNPPISPPQELDIQQVGEDYVITWESVPTATAYRIEWSSALDGGVRFTRIGYTTGTTFTHKNQVGLERGFYRVLSEDNGTGVVRMVGSTT